jgi:hypothetical protein
MQNNRVLSFTQRKTEKILIVTFLEECSNYLKQCFHFV